MGFGGNHKGNISDISTIGNYIISINNVWIVDGLKHKLLSISQFCDSGYEIMFNKNNNIVMNESDKSIGFKGKGKCNVYKIYFSELVYEKILFLLSISDEKWLCHRRLSHVN